MEFPILLLLGFTKGQGYVKGSGICELPLRLAIFMSNRNNLTRDITDMSD